MKVTVLASGSKGNCTLVETESNKFLIDIGINYKTLNKRLHELNVKIEDIDAVFITHEHADHIKGLEVLIKKHNLYIVLSRGTYEAMLINYKIDIMYEYFNIVKPGEEVFLNSTSIVPFLISHDAKEPFGYIITYKNKKLVYITDTGYVSQEIEDKIKNSDIYIFETNHNVEMLLATKRPWPLIQRILGDKGHLCNEDALYSLLRVVGENTKYIYLAHISEEANNEDILMLTVNEIFSKCIYENIKFIVTKQYDLSETVSI